MEERLASDAEENIDNQLLTEVSSRVIGNLRRRADGRNDVESSLQEENLERRFRLAALRSERAELYHLRATRQISNETLQKLLHDLDLLEALLIENRVSAVLPGGGFALPGLRNRIVGPVSVKRASGHYSRLLRYPKPLTTLQPRLRAVRQIDSFAPNHS